MNRKFSLFVVPFFLSIPALSLAADMWGLSIKDGYEFCGVRKRIGLAGYIFTTYANGAELHMNVYRQLDKPTIDEAIGNALKSCNCSQDQATLAASIPQLEPQDRVEFVGGTAKLYRGSQSADLGAISEAAHNAIREYIVKLTEKNACPN